jgi:hypothetical protein
VVNRGSLANVVLRWYEPYQKWQITNDGSVYANIATIGNRSYLTAVIEDPAPALGGNLNVNGQTISSNVGNINFTGNLQINNADGNATVVYAASPAAGVSGVYVVNGAAANQELVTKTRAFGYSLIL